MKPHGPLDDAMEAPEGAELSHGHRVRPYTVTGGRTRPAAPLALETIIMARSGAGDLPSRGHLGPDHRRALQLAAEPSSVAEIAARLVTPLGVARVLVGDLLAEGLVEASATASPDANADVRLLERVLHGIQAL